LVSLVNNQLICGW